MTDALGGAGGAGGPVLEGADAAREWRAVLDRVGGLVRDTVADDGEQAMGLSVPATPDWSAHDLLAHMTGLVVSVLDGDEPGDHNPGWTQAHVDDRRDRTSLEILAAWEERADAMEAYVRDQDTRPLNDAVIHEQDLRGALERPGARDTAGLASVRETLAERLGAILRDDHPDLAPLALRATDDGWSWASGEGDPGLVLEASGFDLARAVTSRRTAEQLGSYVVAGDLEPYLDLFAQLGDLPDRSLPE